jgi:hypothetical protein
MVLPALDKTTGIRVDFIIIHKIFAGKPRDIEDVRTILLKNEGIDIPYIQGWLREFDVSTGKKGFLKTFEKILRGLLHTK